MYSFPIVSLISVNLKAIVCSLCLCHPFLQLNFLAALFFLGPRPIFQLIQFFQFFYPVIPLFQIWQLFRLVHY